MLDSLAPALIGTANDRESRRQLILQSLHQKNDPLLERMADELVDLPEEKSFGQIELTLRDLAHQLATNAHQAGLEAGKKRGTQVPVGSARTARPTHASSAIARRPG